MIDRKPDIEDEMCRIWENETGDYLTKEQNAEKITVLGQEITILGFNVVSNKNKQKIFYYKIKPDGLMIYHIPEGISREERLIIDSILGVIYECLPETQMRPIEDDVKHIKEKLDENMINKKIGQRTGFSLDGGE